MTLPISLSNTLAGRCAAAAAIALAFAAAPASAAGCSINYQVSQSIGGAQLAGTICTDGTIGPLLASNIVSRSLNITNGFANGAQIDTFTFDSSIAANGPSVELRIIGSVNPLSATPTQLLWDFSDIGLGNFASLGFLNTGPGPSEQSYLYWFNSGAAFRRIGFGHNPDYCGPLCGGNGSWISYGPNNVTPPPPIGTVPPPGVPLPGTLAMAVLALAGLGHRQWRSARGARGFSAAA